MLRKNKVLCAVCRLQMHENAHQCRMPLQCKICRISVHRYCYQPQADPTDFQCQVCLEHGGRDRRPKVKCHYCHVYGGALKRIERDACGGKGQRDACGGKGRRETCRYAHVTCMAFSSNFVVQEYSSLTFAEISAKSHFQMGKKSGKCSICSQKINKMERNGFNYCSTPKCQYKAHTACAFLQGEAQARERRWDWRMKDCSPWFNDLFLTFIQQRSPQAHNLIWTSHHPQNSSHRHHNLDLICSKHNRPSQLPCFCGQSIETTWVQCDNCYQWSHIKCQKTTLQEINSDPHALFTCHQCRTWIKVVNAEGKPPYDRHPSLHFYDFVYIHVFYERQAYRVAECDRALLNRVPLSPSLVYYHIFCKEVIYPLVKDRINIPKSLSMLDLQQKCEEEEEASDDCDRDRIGNNGLQYDSSQNQGLLLSRESEKCSRRNSTLLSETVAILRILAANNFELENRRGGSVVEVVESYRKMYMGISQISIRVESGCATHNSGKGLLEPYEHETVNPSSIQGARGQTDVEQASIKEERELKQKERKQKKEEEEEHREQANREKEKEKEQVNREKEKKKKKNKRQKKKEKTDEQKEVREQADVQKEVKEQADEQMEVREQANQKKDHKEFAYEEEIDQSQTEIHQDPNLNLNQQPNLQNYFQSSHNLQPPSSRSRSSPHRTIVINCQKMESTHLNHKNDHSNNNNKRSIRKQPFNPNCPKMEPKVNAGGAATMYPLALVKSVRDQKYLQGPGTGIVVKSQAIQVHQQSSLQIAIEQFLHIVSLHSLTNKWKQSNIYNEKELGYRFRYQYLKSDMIVKSNCQFLKRMLDMAEIQRSEEVEVEMKMELDGLEQQQQKQQSKEQQKEQQKQQQKYEEVLNVKMGGRYLKRWLSEQLQEEEWGARLSLSFIKKNRQQALATGYGDQLSHIHTICQQFCQFTLQFTGKSVEHYQGYAVLLRESICSSEPLPADRYTLLLNFLHNITRHNLKQYPHSYSVAQQLSERLLKSPVVRKQMDTGCYRSLERVVERLGVRVGEHPWLEEQMRKNRELDGIVRRSEGWGCLEMGKLMMRRNGLRRAKAYCVSAGIQYRCQEVEQQLLWCGLCQRGLDLIPEPILEGLRQMPKFNHHKDDQPLIKALLLASLAPNPEIPYCQLTRLTNILQKQHFPDSPLKHTLLELQVSAKEEVTTISKFLMAFAERVSNPRAQTQLFEKIVIFRQLEHLKTSPFDFRRQIAEVKEILGMEHEVHLAMRRARRAGEMGKLKALRGELLVIPFLNNQIGNDMNGMNHTSETNGMNHTSETNGMNQQKQTDERN